MMAALWTLVGVWPRNYLGSNFGERVMTGTWIPRAVCILSLSASAMLLGFVASASAQKAGKETEATEAAKPRLPNHYAAVVTDEQRTKINAIQLDFAPRIEAKRNELKALVSQRDAAIEKVLSAEQRKEVEKLRAEASAKRKARAKESTKTKQDAGAGKAKDAA
jgi:hypothetical protein